MNSINTHYERFLKEFSHLNNDDLIQRFNNSVGINFFGIAIQGYFLAIRKELVKRNIDFSVIGDENSISFANEVSLVKNKLIIRTILT